MQRSIFPEEKANHMLNFSALRIFQIHAMVCTFARNNKKNKITLLYPSSFQRLSLRYKYTLICVFVHPQLAPFPPPPTIISVDFSFCFTWEKESYQISTADKGPSVLWWKGFWFRNQTVKYLSSNCSEWVFSC